MATDELTADAYAAALALFGIDQALLTALLPGPDDGATSPPANQPSAANHSTLTAEQRLAHLEAEDYTHYAALHQRAIHHLAHRLRQGEAVVEKLFLDLLDRFAGKLTYAPNDFAALINGVADLPLQTVEGQLLLRYLQALACNLLDQLDEALTRYNALLAEPWLPPTLRGRILNSSAVCYEMTGVYQEAIDRYQQTLDLWRRLGNRSREGQLLLNLGGLYAEWREYAQAESYLRQAIDCFTATKNWLDLASAQNELGRLYTELGQWTAALTLLEAAAQRRRQEKNWDSLGVAYHTIGYLHLLRGDLTQAQDYLTQSLHYQEANATRVEVYRDLGIIAQIQADLPGAADYYRQALTIAQQMNRREMLAPIHYHLAEVLRRLADRAGALQHYYAAVDVIETARTPLQDESLKISLLGRWQQVYEALVLYCLALGRPAEALQWAERTRARAFADQVVTEEDDVENNGTEHIGTTPASPALVTLAAFQSAIPAHSAVLLYFTTGVVERDMPMWEQLAPDHPLRAHLLPPAHTLFFWVTANTFVHAFCPIDPNLFVSAELALGHVETLLDPETLQGMSGVLVEPLRDLVGASALTQTQKLFVIPHGPLHQLPFDLLFAQLTPPPLALHLAYAPSGAILYHQWQRTVATASDAWLAHPVTIGYNSAFLQQAESEAYFVARLLGGVAWCGPDAKKAQVQQAVRAAGLLHIACHGEFAPHEPIASYLEIGADERLTAAEIMQTWQLQARLVTVSACQTGVVKVLRGDEPMGLVRALLTAGARAVLVSRWPVEDTATLLLMQYFYREMLARAKERTPVDLAQLLHYAQHWLRGLTGEAVQQHLAALPLPPAIQQTWLAQAQPFAHPKYWAAFMVVGE